MEQITFYNQSNSNSFQLTFVVIVACYHNQWVIVRHRDRTTWEVPGGHIEQHESALEAAQRELYEETGACKYNLTPIDIYGVQNDNGHSTYGFLYYAEISALGSIPAFEIAERKLCSIIDAPLTYPKIQPVLIRKVQNTLKLVSAQVINNIPELSACPYVMPIDKGYSQEKKYFCYQYPQHHQLLRLASCDKLAAKQQEFTIMHKLYQLDVRCPKPHAVGLTKDKQHAYFLVDYLIGQDAEIILPTLSENEQYAIGLAAGKDLWRMHQLKAPPAYHNWGQRQAKKMKRYIESYHQCNSHLPHDTKLLAYLETLQPLMKGRPATFQHDDFHPANIIVNHKKYEGVIDFNRFDWGDPWHDFYKLFFFSRDVSIPFCIGQIHGYFNGNPPELFWKLNALYTIHVLFSSVVWTLKVIPEGIEDMLMRIERVRTDFKDFSIYIPSWFQA